MKTGSSLPGAELTVSDVVAARELLEPHVERTPLVPVRASLLPRDDVELYLKLECKQVSGAFKGRGARHYLLRLLEVERPAGVITYSSGNHGRAVAEAAQHFGVPALVTVPDHVDRSKEAAIRAAGAEVVHAGPTSVSRYVAARDLAEERGWAIVPPFDHPWIVAGQGTTALEILEEVDPVAVWSPVGGGGLTSGVGVVLRDRRPDTVLHPVEPVGAAALATSWDQGERVSLESTDSVADGLLPLAVGELNWTLLRTANAHPVTVEDPVILRSLRTLREELDVAAEPSGAVAASPILAGGVDPSALEPGVHVAIVSGGNVDPARLERLLA